MPPRERKARVAGVDIQDSEEFRPLIEAIEEDNPDATVLRMPGIVKVQVPGDMTLNRETVEAKLGREWDTNEFQVAMVSMSGNVKEWDEDEIVIGWNR